MMMLLMMLLILMMMMMLMMMMIMMMMMMGRAAVDIQRHSFVALFIQIAVFEVWLLLPPPLPPL